MTENFIWVCKVYPSKLNTTKKKQEHKPIKLVYTEKEWDALVEQSEMILDFRGKNE